MPKNPLSDISHLIKNSRLNIIVKPNSPKTLISGFDKEKLSFRVDVKAEPEKGKANKEVVKFFKRLLKKDVKIISGFKSRQKTLLIQDGND